MGNEAVLNQVLSAQMEQPKSSIGIFDLPCGYLSPDGELITEVKVREITGAEEDMLAAKNVPPGKKITQLLGNCLERLGQMTDKPMLVRCARDLLIGDRVFLMLAIRRVTLGDEFPYEAKCPECDKKGLYSVNLAELTVKKMPDPKKRVFDAILPNGKKVRWHAMTGKEEETLSRVPTSDSLSASIFVRLDTIDDQPPGDLSAVKALSMRDRTFLRDAFDDAEGGIETTLDHTCPECGAEFKDNLDVGQTGFFFPSRTLKRSKTTFASV
jgi:hypothetical protein